VVIVVAGDDATVVPFVADVVSGAAVVVVGCADSAAAGAVVGLGASVASVASSSSPQAASSATATNEHNIRFMVSPTCLASRLDLDAHDDILRHALTTIIYHIQNS
jgi:hypothetical protein